MKFTTRPHYDASAQDLLSQSREMTQPWQSDKAMRVLLAYVRNLVQAIVRKEQPTGLLPPELANLRVMGMSITAERAGLKRCCVSRHALPPLPNGQLSHDDSSSTRGTDYSIGYLLAYLSSSLAVGGNSDPRLSASELPYLGMTLTIFHQPTWVTQQAEDRIACVLPQVHGLVLDHPQGHAMLLPQADDDMAHPDDASRLLDRLSTQACLGPDAWRRDPQAQLLVFHVKEFQSEPSLDELGSLSLSASKTQQLMDAFHAAANPVEQAGDHTAGKAAGQTAINNISGDDILGKISPMFMALELTTQSGKCVCAGGQAKTLLSLATTLGKQLRRVNGPSWDIALDPVVRICSYWRPILLQPSDPHAQTHLVAACMLHLQSDKGGKLLLGGRMTTAQIVAWRAGSLEITALTSRTHELRQRRRPPQKR